MAVDAVSSSAKASETAGRGITQMKTEDFFKLLIAELQYQDPFEPMDNAKMVEQISGIRSMESSANLSLALQSVTRQQNFAAGAGLIGKMVTGVVTDSGGNEYAVEGVVTGVRFEKDGRVILELDTGEAIPMEAVTRVQDQSPAAPGIGSAGGDSTGGSGSDGGDPTGSPASAPALVA